MAAKLTAKQEKFVKEYLTDLNATQAAIRAGYSEKTAYSQGQRLLKNVEIQKELAKHQKALQDKTEITQEKVIEELAAIGFANATDFAVNGIPITDNTQHKTSSKLKALELLGKTLGLFDKIETGEAEDLSPLAELLKDE